VCYFFLSFSPQKESRLERLSIFLVPFHSINVRWSLFLREHSSTVPWRGDFLCPLETFCHLNCLPDPPFERCHGLTISLFALSLSSFVFCNRTDSFFQWFDPLNRSTFPVVSPCRPFQSPCTPPWIFLFPFFPPLLCPHVPGFQGDFC